MTVLDAERVVMPWGIHEGRTLGEVAAKDVTYFDFLLGVVGMDFFLAEAVGVVAAKHGRAAKRGGRGAGSMQGELSF